MPTSLVDESPQPNDVFSHGPLHIISYIKSWRLVPKVFAVVNPAFLKIADLKAWLFKNLPRGHTHEGVIGGEVFVVDSIIKCLTQPREGETVDPDHVVMSTQHLLGGSEEDSITLCMEYMLFCRYYFLYDGAMEVSINFFNTRAT